MILGRKKKDWDDQYDEYYTQQDPEYDRRVKPLLWVHILILLTFAGLFLVIVGVASDGMMVEKTLKAIFTPVGAVWGLLALTVYFSLVFKAGKTAIVAFVCWLLLTVGGNGLVEQAFANYMERSYLESNPFSDEPYDVVFVLGGGTTTAANGNPQLGSQGDRVMLAARLYFAGKAKKIISSGYKKYRRNKKDMHYYEETIEILKDLNVPESALGKMAGSSTSEEIEEMRKWLDANPPPADFRIGILTSAWHLRRAMALADQAGIDAQPIPAAFRSNYYRPGPSIVIPSAPNLNATSEMIHELLGRMIGR